MHALLTAEPRPAEDKEDIPFEFTLKGPLVTLQLPSLPHLTVLIDEKPLLLGEGAYGKVYLAKRLDNHAQVPLKLATMGGCSVTFLT